MKAYKGFNKDLKCRHFQYEIGKEYETDKAKLCNEGFHACEYPLDCFGYYSPANSRFCEVEIEDNGERNSTDTKVCGKKIKIGAELGIRGIIHAAFEYTKEHCINNIQGGDFSALTGGYGSARTGGYRSALRGGDCSALKGGDRSALATGNRSALIGGDWSALVGGDRSALRGDDWSALIGGDWSALTSGNNSALAGGNKSTLTGGDRSVLTGGYQSTLAGGYQSTLRGGDKSVLIGGDRSVVYGGEGAKVCAGKGSVLALQYWLYGKFMCIKFKEVDGEKIKAGVFYKLDKAGRFIEVKD